MSRTNCGFHHTSAGAEYFSGRGPFAERRIGGLRGHRQKVDPKHMQELAQFAGCQHIIDIRNVSGCHFRTVAFKFFSRAWHDRDADNLCRIDLFTFCKVALDDSAHHLLRALAGRQIRNQVGIELFHKLDPARRTACEHWQDTALRYPLREFGSLFHNGQVRGKGCIEHAGKSDPAKRSDHFPVDILSRFHTKLLRQADRDGRGVLYNHHFFRVGECSHHFIDIGMFRKSAGRADNNALSAIDAGGNIQSLVKRSADIGFASAINKVN